MDRNISVSAAPEGNDRNRARLIRRRFMKMEKFDLESIDKVLKPTNNISVRKKLAIFDENRAEFSKESEYLYALLWRDGWRNKHLDECEKLVIRIGSLFNVFRASLWQLEALCAEMDLSFSGGFVRRRLDSALMIEQKLWFSQAQLGPVTSNFHAVAKYVVKLLSVCREEEVKIVYLNDRDTIVGTDTVALGRRKFVNIEVREILEFALRASAHGFILAHNHPSGNSDPSEQDIHMTRNIEAAARMLNVPLFDHIIVGGSAWFSFRMAGILENTVR
jgi:DNA repair protein RadC